MFLLLIVALAESRRHRHHTSHKHNTNSALDDLRGTSCDMGNIEAEVLFPQRKRSNAREIELMKLLNDLVSPRPESIARKVRQSGEALSRKYLQQIAEALQATGGKVANARKLKARAQRAKRLLDLSRLTDTGVESLNDALVDIARLIGIPL